MFKVMIADNYMMVVNNKDSIHAHTSTHAQTQAHTH